MKTIALKLFFENFVILFKQKLENDKVWHRIGKFNWIYLYYTDKKSENSKSNQVFISYITQLVHLTSSKKASLYRRLKYPARYSPLSNNNA